MGEEEGVVPNWPLMNRDVSSRTTAILAALIRIGANRLRHRRVTFSFVNHYLSTEQPQVPSFTKISSQITKISKYSISSSIKLYIFLLYRKVAN